MSLSVEAFYEKLQSLVQQHFPTAKLEPKEINPLRLKVRIILSEMVFIDVFYGRRKNRVDFALIREERRIFGIDNLQGWHRHPLEAPESHVKMKEPSMEDIFTELAQLLKQLKSNAQ